MNDDDVVVGRRYLSCCFAQGAVPLPPGKFRFLPFAIPLEYINSDTGESGPLPPGDYKLRVEWQGAHRLNPSASIDLQVN